MSYKKQLQMKLYDIQAVRKWEVAESWKTMFWQRNWKELKKYTFHETSET